VAATSREKPEESWLFPLQGMDRIGIAAVGCAMFAAAHYGMERLLRARSRRLILHFGPGMEAAAEALRRHVNRSGYPAEIVLDPERTVASVDLAVLCDVALRVLPPAVLALRPDYINWRRHEKRPYDIVKRVFDVGCAALLLALSTPLMALAAIGIALGDGRPVLFRQSRVGRFGRRFTLLKFRTLRAETAPSANPNDAIEERVFRFGAFLRRTRLDELPQLVNIVRGDMSLVGPRPEMDFFHESWTGSIPFYHKRLLVRPGLSGWAQVRFPHTTAETDYWDKTAHDLWYVAHRNMLLDLRIILRTAGVMLFGMGAR
jgi:lipopolysaccharide/colanic/teichoic acid biosynthesis glycosyltransferase